jgi:hypothetical protein
VEGEGGEGRIEAEDDRVTLENPGEGRAGAEGAIGVFVALDEALGVPAPGQQRVGGAEAAANASERRKTSETSPIIDGLRRTFMGLPLASHWAELMFW